MGDGMSDIAELFTDRTVTISGLFNDEPTTVRLIRNVTLHSGWCVTCQRLYSPRKWAIRWHRFTRRHDPAYRMKDVPVEVTA